ncbi:Bloom syndrome protein-like [Stylophora pistillata]|uniref:DNA 3'-5' helicase n=1 Tax=Stylophora pistillata TaxID=50429 RepID=A0A2B4SN83_STYPI|nr:Bloom syndrome protein-like [Stylophora pistillata]
MNVREAINFGLNKVNFEDIRENQRKFRNRNEEASEGKYNLVFTSPEALFGSHRSTILTLTNKIEAVFIDEVRCVAKCGNKEAFREDYARLAEMRSFLKQGAPFIALTATATDAVRKVIIRDLMMKDCVQFITVPNKQNIRFSVSSVDPDDLETSFQWLIDDLKSKKRNAQKTHPLVKETVEKGFCKVNGSVRVVFCTIAFGMGVNVEGAYIALHFGPSSCLDDYLQEVGRIGRSSDKQSHAVLLTYSGCTRGKNITNGRKEYVRNTDVCRHSLLIQPFLDCQDKPDEETRMERHSCCDNNIIDLVPVYIE